MMLAAGAVTVGASATVVQGPAAAHRLDIRLDPTGHKLSGTDIVQVTPAGRETAEFRISGRVKIVEVTVEGLPVELSLKDGRLNIPLSESQRSDPVLIEIRYEGVFNDPVPLRPLNTDNPGFGVSATISEKGCLLLDGAGWYPSLTGARETFRLKVSAPDGWLAVTAGRSLSHRNENGRGISEWLIDHPVDGLALSAGHYRVTTKPLGDVQAATYFLSDEPEMAREYLEAVERYLTLYTELFGPYPFDKFAVVENFFPTGYGFPSYTLLGGTVLRLPFIIATSLGHEIAHCWWGNGVWVDYDRGNWGEGLTTYVADYLYNERRSPAEARAYRLEILRNYASLVTPEDDFPLTDFSSRTSPLTKAVGYDKGAMVFHMLRRLIGEDAFWGGLRDLYRDRLFRATSWDHLQAAFEHRARRPLDDFFAQWVQQPGAPRLALADVSATGPSESGSWRIQGKILQQDHPFAFPVVLQLETSGETIAQSLQVKDRLTTFTFTGTSAPRVLIVDPEADLMRRLDPQEIPPTVNSLKGSAMVTVIFAGSVSRLGSTAETLIGALGLARFRTVALEDLPRDTLPDSDLLVIGLPRTSGPLVGLLKGVHAESDGFLLDGERYRNPGDTFFGVFTHPTASNRAVGILWPLSERDDERVARKITHYGKYSYLAFRDGRNTAKGVWPADRSPLVHRWPPEQTGRR